MGYLKLKSLILSMVFIFAIIQSGCAALNKNLTINLQEEKVNEILQSSNASQNLPFQMDRIDMKDGFIRVYMSYANRDGSKMTGSYDIRMSIQDGVPVADISNVDMIGLKLDQQILDQIGQLMIRDLVFAAANLNGQVEFQSINITENDMQIVIKISS